MDITRVTVQRRTIKEAMEELVESLKESATTVEKWVTKRQIAGRKKKTLASVSLFV